MEDAVICPAIESPLTAFARLLREQIALSDRLETIADGLPNEIDVYCCTDLAERVPAVVSLTSDIDHRILFPSLLRSQVQHALSPQTVERLSSERIKDQCYAQEIGELLCRLARRRPIEDANAAGYMLRGFFEAARRSAAFELEYIIPIAQLNLTRWDLREMARLLEGHLMVLPAACSLTRRRVMSHTLH